MEKIKLGKRLSMAASLCREGSFIADVGTDHAYLPIYLWQTGVIRGGVVSDVNKGPIERARAHIREQGAEDVLSSVHCDGLSALEGYSPEDIFILGMGGELIAKIIEGGEWTKRAGIRLVLQPMTHHESLRRFLLSSGYEIVDERLVKEDRIYQIMVAQYSGTIDSYDDLELLLGRINIERRDELLLELAERIERVLLNIIDGKRMADADCSYELGLVKKIGELK